MVQIFEEVKCKAAVLKPIFDKAFASIPAFKFIDTEKLILGFYFFFVYKDFVLRELLFWFSGCDGPNINESNDLKQIFIDKIAREYGKFITYDFVQWMNLMLAIEVFQSYFSIVSPNEAQPVSETTSVEVLESRNYQNLMKRYL